MSVNNIRCAYLLDVHSRIWLGDGKGLDTLPIAPMAYRSATTEPDSLLALLDELIEHMNDKYARLKELRLAKLTRELCHAEMPLDVLDIDELARYTKSADSKISAKIVQRLRDIAAVGPAAGIVPLLATQRPSSKVVDPDVRDLIPIRWALRCPTWHMSDVILGAGAASRGANAAELDDDHKGVAVLVSGPTPVTFRAYRTEIEDLDGVSNFAYGLRKLAGVLPASAGPRPVPPILAAMLAVFDVRGVDRLPSADMVAALAHADAGRWGALDQTSLATALRPFQLGPKNLGGLNVRGYRRAAVDEAVRRAM